MKKQKKKSNIDAINEINEKALAAGMSYGQYVLMLELQKQEAERKERKRQQAAEAEQKQKQAEAELKRQQAAEAERHARKTIKVNGIVIPERLIKAKLQRG